MQQVQITNSGTITATIVSFHSTTHILGQMEGQTPPTASQIDNTHAVLNTGVITVLFEHGDLGFLKGGGRCGPQAGGILFAGSQAQIVKLGGYLVVLLVGVVGGNRNGHRLELVDDGELLVQFLLGAVAGKNIEMVPVYFCIRSSAVMVS